MSSLCREDRLQFSYSFLIVFMKARAVKKRSWQRGTSSYNEVNQFHVQRKLFTWVKDIALPWLQNSYVNIFSLRRFYLFFGKNTFPSVGRLSVNCSEQIRSFKILFWMSQNVVRNFKVYNRCSVQVLTLNVEICSTTFMRTILRLPLPPQMRF